MVKSSRSHYASHCISLHYDDDVGFDTEDDCVALASDDDDDDEDSSGNVPIPSPYISELVLFFLFFMMPFLEI